MPNTFNKVSDWLATEGLRHLVNSLECAEYFDTSYGKEFTKSFAVGTTVNINLPQRFLGRRGTLAYTPEGLARPTTSVTIDQIEGVDFEFDSLEQALSMERGKKEFAEQYLKPAMLHLAQRIDSTCADFAARNTNNVVGALGTDPTSLDTYQKARQILKENSCPPGERGMVISPSMMRVIGGAQATIFNPGETVSKFFKEGYINRGASFDWYESMSLRRHTAGTWAGAVTVAGAGQSGATLLVNCTNGDTFKNGDTISIAAVNNVNPRTRVSTGSLKHFVITADTTAAGSTVTLPIYPSIVGPGEQQQNVDALPANTAALTLMPGTTSPNGKTGTVGLAMNRNAFALVSVKLETPTKAEMAETKTDPQTGISIRFIRDFDPVQSKMINRFDAVWGFGRLYADQCAIKIVGA